VDCTCRMCAAYRRDHAYQLDEHEILTHHDADLRESCQEVLGASAGLPAVLALRAEVLATLPAWAGHSACESVAYWLLRVCQDVHFLSHSGEPWSVYSMTRLAPEIELHLKEVRKRVDSLRRNWSSEDRADAVQDVFTRLCEHLRVPRGLSEPPIRYLKSITRSVVSNTTNKKNRRETVPNDSLADKVANRTDEIERVDSKLYYEYFLRKFLVHAKTNPEELRDIIPTGSQEPDEQLWENWCARLNGFVVRGARKHGLSLDHAYAIGHVALFDLVGGDESGPTANRMRETLRTALSIKTPHMQALKRGFGTIRKLE
jgi:hypothetical protein